MKEKQWKNVTAAAAIAVLAAGGLLSLLQPDTEISVTERRRLAEPPKLSFSAVFDGSYMKNMETYLLEQFAGRDQLRVLKAEVTTGFLRKADSDGYFKLDDAVYKLEYELNEKNIKRAAYHFAAIAEAYFPEADRYYSVIPEKNYFLPPDSGYPVLDYAALDEMMQEHLTGAVSIDIYGTLSRDAYYRTDLHWRQESIVDTAKLLLEQMGEPEATPKVWETENSEAAGESYGMSTAAENFKGGYARASAFRIKPDSLCYLTNDTIAAATVYDYEIKKTTAVYAWEKLGQTDDYDFFLGGARALLTIENTQAPEDGKKLIVFRDSFGSSIAPLLLEGYQTVTLVDLRYVTMAYAGELLKDTVYDDVLFLYSGILLNHSDSMRF